MKLDINLDDIFVQSQIFEFTWFEVQPMVLSFFIEQPESLLEMYNKFMKEDLDGSLTIGYLVDAISLKMYTVKYPTYCTIDIASLITKGEYISCGMKGDDHRVVPLAA